MCYIPVVFCCPGLLYYTCLRFNLTILFHLYILLFISFVCFVVVEYNLLTVGFIVFIQVRLRFSLLFVFSFNFIPALKCLQTNRHNLINLKTLTHTTTKNEYIHIFFLIVYFLICVWKLFILTCSLLF